MKPKIPDFKYCPLCGASVDKLFHEGRDRHVCPECGHVLYVNPIPASTLVVLNEGHVLLVLRAVEPQKGEWCLPGGFLEWGESPEEGGKRELLEETGLVGDELEFVGYYNSMVTMHAVLLGFRVKRWHGDLYHGDDAEDVRWYRLDSRPPLAFAAHEQLLADALKRESDI